MLSEHEWIAADQQFFGQPNTSYDFKATDPVEASKRIGKLEEARSKLGKSINKRAMKMLGKAEEQVCFRNCNSLLEGSRNACLQLWEVEQVYAAVCLVLCDLRLHLCWCYNLITSILTVHIGAGCGGVNF